MAESGQNKVETNSSALLADALAGSRGYHVPSRFGLLPLLVITAIVALTFAVLRRLDAPASMYGFLGCLALAVFILQSYFPNTPRLVSVLAGGTLLALWVIIFPGDWLGGGGTRREIASTLIWFFIGGIVGYLVGSVCAGIFLVLDMYREYGSWREVCRTIGERLHEAVRSVNTGTQTWAPGPVPDAPLSGEASLASGGASGGVLENAFDDHLHIKPLRRSDGSLCNCVLYVSRCSEDTYRARFAQLDWPPGYGVNARAAMQSAIFIFKQRVRQSHIRAEPIPWLSEPYPILPYEQEQWVAVHLDWPNIRVRQRS